ncbi:MAG: hybrid sensor histidine kinase/response regulator [Planctomycetota bacterium]|jgi:PAS domain S-box-containing protein
MSVILLLSIAMRLVACGWTARATARVRDWRLGLMAVMLAFMAARQIWTMALTFDQADWAPRFTGQWQELPGLAVSVMAFVAVVFLARMLEEREQASAQLRIERDFADALLTTQATLVVVLDAQGGIVRFNRACETLTGRTEEAVRGRPFWETVVPPAQVDATRDAFHALLERGGADARVTPWLGPDGRPRLVAWRRVVLHATAHRPAHVIATGIDQTERARLEEQLQQAQKMEAVGQLAGGVAHDFNNLLAVILGQGSLLLESLEDRPAEAAQVNAMLRAGDRAATLTRQLLNFGRPESGDARQVDVGRALDELRPILEAAAHPTAQLECTILGPLPPIHVDPVALEQVVLNLVTNARDASPPGATVRLRAAAVEHAAPPGGSHPAVPAGSFVQVEVSDDGDGMDAGTQARIFEPFFTSKSRERGTGLGLAVVFGIVGNAGGTIVVESAPGAGTTFRVLWPATAAVPAPEPPAPAAAPAGAEGHIWVIEDESMVRDLVCRVLESRGYRVTAFGDAETALAAALDDRPDLLLTDVMLPGVTGIAAARTLRKAQPALPVVLMSGYTGAAPDAATDPHVFLAKPFAPTALLQAVTAARASHSAGGRAT